MIFETMERVTLVGAADVSRSVLEKVLTLAPALVAADGGADNLMRLGREPRAVIGDFDSLSAAAREAFADRLIHVTEQDSTDFDKVLQAVSAPLVIALGVMGGRFDHDLASMFVLLRYPEKPCIVVGSESIAFVCPAQIDLSLEPGSLFSLFPFAPVSVRSDGLRWPTEGLAFSPLSQIGTSNEVIGPVRLEASSPDMMIILPLAAMEQAITALQAAARWPVRAR